MNENTLTTNNVNTTSPGFYVRVNGVQVDIKAGTNNDGIHDNSINIYQNDGATRPIGFPGDMNNAASPDIVATRLVKFEGPNSGAWDHATLNPQLSYVTGGGIVDLAGNEMATDRDNDTFVGDVSAPEIFGDIVLSPNSATRDTIVIN